MRLFVDSILYSYAQIFFTNRRWFGAAVLASTMLMPRAGLLALLGVVLSNTMAAWLKFDTEKIRSGFYGFNGILLGAAASFYYEIDIFLFALILIFIIISFFVTAVLENHLAVAFNLPGLSLPFVLSIYIFIIFLSNYDFINLADASANDAGYFSSLPQLVIYYFKSMALIIFQPNIISGIIITAALLIFSRVLFTLSIVAFVLNYIFLGLILPGMKDNLIILSSFNSILTAFALGGSLIIPSRKSFFLVIVSTMMVVIFTGFFTRLLSGTYLPLLVLPFNFIVLTAIYSLKFRKDQTDLVLLYFKPGSPEENLYYHNQRKARFDKFKYVFPEFPFFGEWFINQAFEGEHTHKDEWKYAWDFVVVDEKQNQYSGSGDNLTDYFCYSLPAAAVLDGEVVKVIDTIPDNKIGDVNIRKNWGNTVILKHEYGLFSALSHLAADSVKVKEGEKIKKGDIIGKCGNSGRSQYPHIHFQFQTSDKLGDKTYEFPFAHYIANRNGRFELMAFAYPAEGELVRNVEVHKSIKNAFMMRFGEKLKFEYEYKGETKVEEWEIKINMNSDKYIESSEGDIVVIYQTDKVFYLTSYIGEKKSALYYFYLIALRVPLCYQQNLHWNDEYSIAHLPCGWARYASEFLLFFGEMLKAKGNFTYAEQPEDVASYSIKADIQIKGSGIFSFYSKKFNGALTIDPDEGIEEFEFYENNIKIFNAKKLINEEKQ